MITAPAILPGLDNEAYQADPIMGGSLSVSGAKKLLPPHCPALYRYELDNPPRSTATFDYGHAAHRAILGAGSVIAWVDAEDWRSKDAKATRAEAVASGLTPMLIAERAHIDGMAAAIRAHPVASQILDPEQGDPEVSVFVGDPATGVTMRARYDYMRRTTSGRLAIVDYKTAASAHPSSWRRSAADYGYHMQDAWYRRTARLLGLDDDPLFIFIVQEKRAPYLVSVMEMDEIARRIGDERNRRALDLYAMCKASDTWPGYTDTITTVDLPVWVEIAHEQESLT